MAERTKSNSSGKVPHAFGLPAGSIRALLALGVAGTVAAALLLRADRQVPYHIQNVLFIILGHYFAARKAPATDAGPSPLYLPRGSIRFFLIAGFVTVGVVLYRQDRLLALGDHPGVMTLLLVFGFLVGVVLTRLLTLGSRQPPRIIEDLRAALSLVAAIVLVLLVLHELEILHAGEFDAWCDRLMSWRAQYVSAALVSFYFGSRS